MKRTMEVSNRICDIMKSEEAKIARNGKDFKLYEKALKRYHSLLERGLVRKSGPQIIVGNSIDNSEIIYHKYTSRD